MKQILIFRDYPYDETLETIIKMLKENKDLFIELDDDMGDDDLEDFR